ncbi:hypothetical protein AA101099_2616 [Neoasaia chiangmaiensis NBRC 101099]|uniref:hypothetical protein n=1 Tax=Neoasaia chiangmaiensis TaxID=320497 RepID=UPI0011904C9C|nr:hypothetical protein [Neoasaia chiangmaiensis]GBR41767.1 hypothetical protein AA101099_2616 [Neoasaia chiangmaiensis NBRC 101099]GEN14307.1 hypothetical protein NCH01_07380 [Neoasaia chiangmaiensis]
MASSWKWEASDKGEGGRTMQAVQLSGGVRYDIQIKERILRQTHALSAWRKKEPQDIETHSQQGQKGMFSMVLGSMPLFSCCKKRGDPGNAMWRKWRFPTGFSIEVCVIGMLFTKS